MSTPEHTMETRGRRDEDAFSLIVESGLYRHRTLRRSLETAFLKDGDPVQWKQLKSAHWEVLYFLIESHIMGKQSAVTDVPLATGMSTSTARRALRHLEDLGLAVTHGDKTDKRRFHTQLAAPYQVVVDEFIGDYSGGLVGFILRHDKRERKQAEEALERTRAELMDSEAQLLQAQKMANMGHWVWDDIKNNYISVSEENARIHGLTLEEFLGDQSISYFDDRFVHPDDRENYRAIVAEADRAAIGYDTRHRIVRADGAVRYVREISQPLLSRDGRLIRSIGTTQDITESVELENSIRENEARLLHAQRLTQLGYWVWDDVNHDYLVVSEETARIHGMAVDEFMGRENKGRFDDEMAHPDDKQTLQDVILEAEANKTGYDLTYRTIRKDGAVRYIRELSEPIYDDDGILRQSIGTTQDVTDITLGESREQLKRILDQLPGLVSVFRPDGTRTYVNEAICQFLGVSRDEFMAREAGTHLPEGVIDKFWERIRSLTKEVPEAIFSGEMADKSSRVHPVHIAVRGMFNEQGELEQVIATSYQVGDTLSDS